MIHSRSKKLIGFIAFMFLLFFLNHFLYLSFGTFDYSYNMMVNIVTGKTLWAEKYEFVINICIVLGVLGGIGWLIWCISKFRKRPYVWKMIVFVILGASSLVSLRHQVDLLNDINFWFTFRFWKYMISHLYSNPLTPTLYGTWAQHQSQ